MSNDSYQPPQAPLQEPSPLPRRPVYGVVVPMLIDIIGTVAAQTVVIIIYATWMASRGATEDQIASALSDESLTEPINLVLRVVGFGFSFLAGVLCIRMSRGVSFLYPLILIAVTFVVGWLLLNQDADVGPLLGWSAVAAALTLAGAAVALRRNGQLGG